MRTPAKLRATSAARRAKARAIVDDVRRELPDDAPGERLRAEAVSRLLRWLASQAGVPGWVGVLLSALTPWLTRVAEELVQEAYDELRRPKKAA